MTSISRREFLTGLGLGALGAVAGGCLSRSVRKDLANAYPSKPNFLFFLMDDLGARDLSCYGSTFYQTPNIDKFARQGMRFTNAYAACPVCSPTRASILTGKYPARLHLTSIDTAVPPKGKKLIEPTVIRALPLEEVTVAEALKPLGYVTGAIGKWHLGGRGFWPENQGFDLNFGGSNAGQPGDYFSPYKTDNVPDGPEGEFLTERLTSEALKFLEANRNNPFLLYFANYTVHTSVGARLQAKKEVIAKYAAKADPKNPQHNATYAAMVESMDDSVGQVLAELDKLGITDNTIVFFMSDNGGMLQSTSNAPLRAGKGTLYEGGIREPMMVRWPGVVKPGALCDMPVISTDFYPTMLAMAGSQPAPGTAPDGVSLVPLLERSGKLHREALYWHYPHYMTADGINAGPCGAVREGDYKLIDFYDGDHLELYDVEHDISEKHNLATEMPERAAELCAKLQAWLKSVDAAMPTPNPDWKPGAPTANVPFDLGLA